MKSIQISKEVILENNRFPIMQKSISHWQDKIGSYHLLKCSSKKKWKVQNCTCTDIIWESGADSTPSPHKTNKHGLRMGKLLNLLLSEQAWQPVPKSKLSQVHCSACCYFHSLKQAKDISTPSAEREGEKNKPDHKSTCKVSQVPSST